MDINLLVELLGVPTHSTQEHLMVAWLIKHVNEHVPGAKVWSDAALNVYVSKGDARYAPCVSAHIDSAQPLNRKFRVIALENGTIIGLSKDDRRVGFGADDKAGVYVCLELLKAFDNICAVFFAAEEIGCLGAQAADAEFFRQVGYLIEFDCPSRGLLSYTSGGRRLFSNDGDFIREALPVLVAHGTVLWQHHPFSDVWIIRKRFPISCLNVSCGYHNWHSPNELVSIPEVELAVCLGTALIVTLGCRTRYHCSAGVIESPAGVAETTPPALRIGPLAVPSALTNRVALAQPQG